MHLKNSARRIIARSAGLCLIALACLPAAGIAQQSDRQQPPRVEAGRQGRAGARSRPSPIPSAVRSALDRITPESLRGHLSFIASDMLEGRNTPSRGLNIAAEYIAAQFRRAGLEPGGDVGEGGERSYFQIADRQLFESSTGSQQSGSSEPASTQSLGQQSLGPQRSETPRNVIGLLPGSDATLKDTYIILSAHYDHIGIGEAVDGDSIYNGANDDGSGTVSVMEIASALATLKKRPKRSILFIAWFGEEKGLLGSIHYGKHPTFPLEKTVAMINLEQVGRTDSSEGPQLNSASLTGFDFTEIGAILQAAGKRTGINVYKHQQNSDDFFGRSDNLALARAGVPAHTLAVAFVFPDYHRPGDQWEKIDYANMARVGRMVALGLLLIANDARAPKWNEANPKTARYVQAWKALHQK